MDTGLWADVACVALDRGVRFLLMGDFRQLVAVLDSFAGARVERPLKDSGAPADNGPPAPRLAPSRGTAAARLGSQAQSRGPAPLYFRLPASASRNGPPGPTRASCRTSPPQIPGAPT